MSMPCSRRDRLDPRARPDQDRRDQAEPGRIDGAAQRALVAGMRDGRRRRRQRLAEVDQPLVLLVAPYGHVASRSWRLTDRLRARVSQQPAACRRLCACARCGGAVQATPRATSASCASIARWSAEGRTLDIRGSVSSRSITISSRSRSAGIGEQRRQRRDRLLRRIADDDVLLAADVPPLVRRQVGQQIVVLVGQLAFERDALERERPALARQQRRGPGERLGKAALGDRGERLLDERQLARVDRGFRCRSCRARPLRRDTARTRCRRSGRTALRSSRRASHGSSRATR